MKRFALALKLAVPLVLIFGNAGVLLGQPDSIYRLPAGTRISLRLDAELSSRVSSVNDTFLAFVTKPVTVRDVVVLPVGTRFEGRVTGVSRAGAGGHNGRLDVVFETLMVSNESRRIDGAMITKFDGGSHGPFRLLGILGGAVVGAALGAATHSSRGALIGTGVGAGAGGAVAMLRKGKEMRIPRDKEFEIELRSSVVLPVLDY